MQTAQELSSDFLQLKGSFYIYAITRCGADFSSDLTPVFSHWVTSMLGIEHCGLRRSRCQVFQGTVIEWTEDLKLQITFDHLIVTHSILYFWRREEASATKNVFSTEQVTLKNSSKERAIYIKVKFVLNLLLILYVRCFLEPLGYLLENVWVFFSRSSVQFIRDCILQIDP